MKIAVASERTDPVFHVKKVINALNVMHYDLLYVISKYPGAVLQPILEYDIPKIIHFTITGLGTTKYEPNVPDMNIAFNNIDRLLGKGILNPEHITIRIDPIIPGVTTNILSIIRLAYNMNIRKIRISVMDMYGHTSSKMLALGYKDFVSKYYTGFQKTKYGTRIGVPHEYLDNISKWFTNILEEFPGLQVYSCAEDIKPPIQQVGCIDYAEVDEIFQSTNKPRIKSLQRVGCQCVGGKYDLLTYEDKCKSNCGYCYAKH